MKKSLYKFITLLCTFLTLTLTTLNVKAQNFCAPNISTEGAALIDGATGKVLYEKNADVPLAPASTTKVMTALLTLEKANLNDKAKIGKIPPNAEGTAIGLIEDEEITVRELLYGLLLESANDCAEALAEHVGGSIEGFAKMMNERAKDLGCTNTNFVNPSGLYEKGHITTAHDLALITREASKNPTFVLISQEPFYKIQPTNKSSEIRWVNNKNCLILKNSKYFYDECITGKTGYTTLSKHTYTAVAEKNNQRLILALLYSEDKDTYFNEAKALFQYGFSRFELMKLYSKGEELAKYNINDKETIPVLASDDFYYIKDRNSNCDENPSLTIEEKNLDNVSFEKGAKILNSSITLNGNTIGTLALTSGVDRQVSIFNNVNISKDNFLFKYPIIYIIGSIILILIVFIIIKKYKKIKSERNSKEGIYP